MKKNLYFGMILAAGLLASSCSNEDEKFVISPENAAQVTFTVGLQDGIATRAISDGASTDKLVYAVYDANENLLGEIEGADENGQFVVGGAFANLTANVALTLAKGQEYTVVFWAQNSNCEAYTTTDLKNVTVDYDGVNNDESRDAFYKAETFTVSGNASIEVTLTRPFAQINLGVTAADWTAAVKSGIEIAESQVVINEAPSSINLMTGEVANPVEVTYALADIPAETLAANEQEYKYLSMSYILASENKELVNSLQFTFAPVAGMPIVFDEGLTSVPVQRNWRTNIVGKVLTGDVDIEITIEPAYNGENTENLDKKYLAEGVYNFAGKEEEIFVDQQIGMNWIVENFSETNGYEGMTIKLETDVDMAELPKMGDSFAPIGSTGERDSRNRLVCEAFKGTFDGQGNKLLNLYQSGWDMGYEWGQYGSIGLFSELENATVKNIVISGFEAQIEGGDIAFIAGSATGTCVFENIVIENSKIGTYNNGIGSIIGWSGAGNYTFKNIEIKEDVVLGGLWGSFDSSVGGVVGQAEPGATYNFDNVEISCRLDVYNDVTASYQYYLYRMSGMLIGRCQKTINIDGRNYPDLSQYNITCNDVTVNFGDWMNYHYCYGFNGSRYTRVESGFAYGGLDINEEGHNEACTDHMLCLPFTAIIGGDQYGVSPITQLDGVTVNYPSSYNPE